MRFKLEAQQTAVCYTVIPSFLARSPSRHLEDSADADSVFWSLMRSFEVDIAPRTDKYEAARLFGRAVVRSKSSIEDWNDALQVR